MTRRRAALALAFMLAPTTVATAACSTDGTSAESVTPVTKTVTASAGATDGNDSVASNSLNAADYRAVSEGREGYFFVTPSGKWRCAIVTDSRPMVAGCQPGDNSRPGIGVAGAPSDVANPVNGSRVAPNAILVQRGEDPQFAWLGQAEFWRIPIEATKVLPYGNTLSAAQFECNVQEAGVSCRDDTTGHGFTFSDAGYVWSFTPVGGTADYGASADGGSGSSAIQFGGEWTGHGRQLDLRSDGSADIRLASGAANSTRWNGTWQQNGDSLTLTFGGVIQQMGDLGRTVAPGTVWTGRMTTAEGASVLEFAELPDVYWCRYADTATGACGA